MKKYLIFYLLYFIFTFSLPSSAQRKFDIHPVKKIEANPINVAFMLAQETDSAKMASICEYYGYQPQTPHTERSSDTASADTPYSTYQHPNGSVIRYSFRDAGGKHPYVEVKSKLDSKDVNSILTELNFKKDGSGYVKKQNIYSKTILTCKHGPQGYWSFHQTAIKYPEKLY